MARAEPAHLADGAQAEALAARFLAARGLAVVAHNVRSRVGEIDLIARDGEVLVFVEVRLRRSASYGGAAASITAAKRGRLIRAAQAYLATLRSPAPPCRFNAILMDGLDGRRIDWRRDVVALDGD